MVFLGKEKNEYWGISNFTNSFILEKYQKNLKGRKQIQRMKIVKMNSQIPGI